MQYGWKVQALVLVLVLLRDHGLYGAFIGVVLSDFTYDANGLLRLGTYDTRSGLHCYVAT